MALTKIGLVVPWSSPFMFAEFFDGNMNMQTPEGCEIRWFRGLGWCPAKRHIDGCAKALDWGAELICILGADQMHPEDTICKLYARFQQGHEIVAAMVPARGYIGWQDMKPFQKMAWRFKSTDDINTKYRTYRSMELDSDMMEVIDPSKGDIQRIDFIGSGVLMFHRDHILSLKFPWFTETFDPVTLTRSANMDCTFLWRLCHEGRATAWVDTTIKVRHLHTFKIDETYPDRFSDWTKPGVGDKSVCAFKHGSPASTEPEADEQAMFNKQLSELRQKYPFQPFSAGEGRDRGCAAASVPGPSLNQEDAA